jgi:glucose/arabinose dehydrogenase
VTHAGDSRLFVVEQRGQIDIVGGGTFLDLSSRIVCCGERGLLGLAFDPDYAENGLFYVDYTRAGDGSVTVAEYQRSADDPNKVDASSERILFSIYQPTLGHHGGMIMFKDHYLYVTVGDGNNGQNQGLDSLRGKILRINPYDPDGRGPKAYRVPNDNPYFGREGRGEIWASGLRNPWRCSFDRLTGELFCGDVGESHWEEIDRSSTGMGDDYGWRALEGTHYYDSAGHALGDLCATDCRTPPILEYPHNMAGRDNNAVTGGYVSRRADAPLYGEYIFGDFGSGRVWMIPADFTPGSPLPPPSADTHYSISSFGEDVEGRLYLVDYDGAVYRIDQS